MYVYSQSTGKLWNEAGHLIGKGYSGFGAGKNNVLMQEIPNVGPIPQGAYAIGDLFQSEAHGPDCMHLTPEEGTNTFGRDGFLMHGDSQQHLGQASHGCVILPHSVRMMVANGEDKRLYVQA